MKPPYCVMVSGSRDLTWGHMDLIVEQLRPYSTRPLSLVIHGAGEGRNATVPGFDRVAAAAARFLKMRCQGYPALWDLQSKVAGPDRNRLLAEILRAHALFGYAPVFLAFPTGGPGTASAISAVESVSKRDSIPVEIQKFPITL
jgi:hypothetical protein